jgi:hypothetical protein
VALPASYTVTWPLATPGATRALTMSSTGDLATAQLSGEQIADLGVGTLQIANAAVTNAKIADSSVNSAKVQDGTITGADIADLTIGTNDIAAGAVTQAKIGAKTAAGSAGTGVYSTPINYNGWVVWRSPPNNAVALATNGRPVLVGLQPTPGSTMWCAVKYVNLLRNGASIATYQNPAPSGVQFVDVPPAGTHTYSFEVASDPNVFEDIGVCNHTVIATVEF